ncbi:RidA family protein [Clostridium sediminicola]|uniref:RidA family protein n=1 Tax=Clostridium sediminicola TaxID=3114879 RepID=UPI0031F26683
MEIKRYEGTGRMSRAVVHNGTIYLCGQTCGDADKDMKEQTRGALEKVEQLLNKYGSDKQHILSTTIYVKDMSMFQDMNEIWDAWVENGFEPARACVEAKMARKEILVELSVIAAVK